MKFGTDWTKVDAHAIQSEEYDDLPEWTEEMFMEADLYEQGRLIRTGHPSMPRKKDTVTRRCVSASPGRNSGTAYGKFGDWEIRGQHMKFK